MGPVKTTIAALTAVIALLLAAMAVAVVEAPGQRFMKIEVCAASGRTYVDCATSTPRTVWDRAHDAILGNVREGKS